MISFHSEWKVSGAKSSLNINYEDTFTEAVTLILDFRLRARTHFPPKISPYKTQFQVLESKNLKIIENIRITISKTRITKIVCV